MKKLNCQTIFILWMGIFGALATARLTHRYCTDGSLESLTEYYSVRLSRQAVWYYYYTCCSTSWTGACNGYCHQTRYTYDYYYGQRTRAIYRLRRFCCPGYTQSGTTCIGDGTWSAWGTWSLCTQDGIDGFQKKKRVRTCTGGACSHGDEEQFSKECSNTYLGTGFSRLRDHPQCEDETCKPKTKQDGTILLNLYRFRLASPLRSLQMYIFSKQTTNGHYDFNLDPTKPSTTFTALSNLELGTSINFSPIVPNGDMILSSFNIPETTLKTKSYYQSTDNAIQYDIFAQLTANPSTDTDVYYTAAFKLWKAVKAGNVRYVIIQKKTKVMQGNLGSISIREKSNELVSKTFNYQGSVLNFRPYVSYGGEERTYDVTLTSLVPNVYAKWTQETTSINVESYFNSYPPSYLTIDKDSNHGLQRIYFPYIDPTVSAQSFSTFYQAKDDGDFMVHPRLVASFSITGFMDGQYCKGGPCTSSNEGVVSTIRVIHHFETYATLRQPQGSFRIKQMNSGRCWASDETNQNVVLSSKCTELFGFTKDSGLVHVATGKTVFEENGAFSLESDSSSTAFHTSRGNAMVRTIDTKTAACVTETTDSSNQLTVDTTTFDIMNTNNTCDGDAKNLIKLLPAYSTELSEKIKLKSILQASVPSFGNVIIICESTQDLARKSNCRYSIDKGVRWIAISPFITAVTYYIPSDGVFYARCNKAMFYCTWDMSTKWIAYIDKTTFESKLLDLQIVQPAIMDELELPLATPTNPLDDPSIGATSNGVYNDLSGTWNKFYIWMN